MAVRTRGGWGDANGRRYNPRVSADDTAVSRYCSARPTGPPLHQWKQTSAAIIFLLGRISRSGVAALAIKPFLRETIIGDIRGMTVSSQASPVKRHTHSYAALFSTAHTTL